MSSFVMRRRAAQMSESLALIIARSPKIEVIITRAAEVVPMTDTFTAGGFEIQGGRVVQQDDGFNLDRIAAAMVGYHVRGFPGQGHTVWRAFDPAGRDLGTDESEAHAWRLAIGCHERSPG